jgi:hypothetical protein
MPLAQDEIEVSLNTARKPRVLQPGTSTDDVLTGTGRGLLLSPDHVADRIVTVSHKNRYIPQWTEPRSLRYNTRARAVPRCSWVEISSYYRLHIDQTVLP